MADKTHLSDDERRFARDLLEELDIMDSTWRVDKLADAMREIREHSHTEAVDVISGLLREGG